MLSVAVEVEGGRPVESFACGNFIDVEAVDAELAVESEVTGDSIGGDIDIAHGDGSVSGVLVCDFSHT